ncbi:hypothetical protein LIER_41655 [Lithospermum erythrorhizon]|uniref:Uncharacterized protein n=1 Tax=Lithospermum erythrorhizon TaxID=34254 RepID=A0AAV3RFZ5_LITER
MKRQNTIAHKPKRGETVDLSEEISIPHGQEEAPISSSDSLPEEGANSVHKAMNGYSTNFMEIPYMLPDDFYITVDTTLWRKSDAFHASRPLLLERLRKEYDGVHGVE